MEDLNPSYRSHIMDLDHSHIVSDFLYFNLLHFTSRRVRDRNLVSCSNKLLGRGIYIFTVKSSRVRVFRRWLSATAFFCTDEIFKDYIIWLNLIWRGSFFVFSSMSVILA